MPLVSISNSHQNFTGIAFYKLNIFVVLL